MDVSTHSDTAIDNRIHHRRDHSTSSTITSPVTGNIPSADSSQQLIVDSHGGSLDDSIGGELGASNQQRQHRQMYGGSTLRARVSPAEWFAMFVLCFVNLINYMDRFTIAGVLNSIQTEFQIGDDLSGLLQTAFVLSYMVCAPIFGYLGDRYSRKWIMILGVALWSGTTLVGSFMGQYGWFLTFRALVGIGEASYSTIAPTIISDMFVDELRSKMLAMFYFAIPVGSGLGYIVGSETAKAFGSWRFALRVTPILGVIAVLLIFVTREPERGQSEGSHNMETTSYKEDLKEIARNPSFMFSTAGFTCVAFVTGALAWWGPTFILAGIQMQPGNEDVTLDEVAYIFGAITMLSGIVGVPLGTVLAQTLKKRYSRADPLICAGGLLCSAPFLLSAMFVVSTNTPLAYVLIFLGSVSLNLNWAIVADILLYVVVPTRRSTAEAFQILISHTLGDAGSPYLVGVISEAIKRTLGYSEVSSNVPEIRFRALQYALFSTAFVEVLGGVFFLVTAIYILHDRAKAEKAVAASASDMELSDSNTSQSLVDAKLTEDF